jgi:hypothetical protein
MKTFAVLLIAASSTSLALPAAAQDVSAAPTYGAVDLKAGFPDDPYTVVMSSGGSIDASSIGSPCTGYIASAPDLRLTYQGGSFPLYIYASSTIDTTLVVNGPDGQWYCDDDGNGGLNPQVTFTKPESGQYDIWLGTYASSEVHEAMLHISEVSRN